VTPAPTLRKEVRSLTRLAAPVVVTQIGYMLTGFVDTAMLGHYSTTDMSAAGLGNLWMMVFQVFAMGVLFGIDPIVSQAHGAKRGERAGLALQQGLVLTIPVGLLTALSWLFTERGLILIGQDPGLAPLAERYALLNLPGLLPFFVFIVLRSYLQGREIVRPAMWLMLAANVFNFFANWVLVFGELGVPELGLAGSAIATSLSRTLMCIALALWIVKGKLHVGAWSGWTRRAFERKGLRAVLGLGLPTGFQMSFEIWAFLIIATWAGWLGDLPLATHIVVIQLASLTYMVPLGISIGATTRMGNLIGADEPQAAQRSAWAAFAMGAAVMLTIGASFWIFRDSLPRLISNDPAVLAAATALIPIAAAFQLSDGTQCVGSGILRGMGRTRPAAFFNLFAYYVLALPVAWFLAFRAELGVHGLWWGLFAGLTTAALLLLAYVKTRGPAHVDARVLADAS